MRELSFVMGLLQCFFGVLLFVHRFQMGSGFEGFWPFLFGLAVVWAAVVFIWEGVINIKRAFRS